MPDSPPIPPSSPAPHIPLGPCPKCSFPIDPGTCPECGTITDDPELLCAATRAKVQRRQLTKWWCRTALLALIPILSAIILTAIMIIFVAVLGGTDAYTWMQKSHLRWVGFDFMPFVQLFGTPLVILALATLALARDRDIPKGHRPIFVLTTILFSAIGWIIGFGIFGIGMVTTIGFPTSP